MVGTLTKKGTTMKKLLLTSLILLSFNASATTYNCADAGRAADYMVSHNFASIDADDQRIMLSELADVYGNASTAFGLIMWKQLTISDAAAYNAMSIADWRDVCESVSD